MAIISKKKFNKIEFYKFKAQGTIFSKQILDRFIEKGFLVGYLGNAVYINTHLVATYKKEKGKRVKILNKQFEQLLGFVKEKIKEGKEIILGGDFNFNSNSRNYKEITKILVDNTLKPILKIKSEYKYGQRDFIFSSKKESENYEEPLYPFYVSDHPGVSVELIS
ncbi:MAG: hypothetical protein NTZ83_05950 [Candidatus Pacearchaeota archaeon]|nr:hypothetical protein [Candidatus Pacearchaeota archaeon]